jgi:hypothetical protein
MRLKLTIAAALIALGSSAIAGPFISTQLGRSWVSSSSNVAWRLTGGYKFMRYFGLEAAYAEYHNDNDAFFTGAKGFLPLTPQFSLTAELGAEYVMDGSQDSMSAGYGVGAQMRLRDSHVKLAAGWHQVNSDNINFVYAGLSYAFF